jgi:hypothetical protein
MVRKEDLNPRITHLLCLMSQIALLVTQTRAFATGWAQHPERMFA